MIAAHDRNRRHHRQRDLVFLQRRARRRAGRARCGNDRQRQEREHTPKKWNAADDNRICRQRARIRKTPRSAGESIQGWGRRANQIRSAESAELGNRF